jgi:hypothetical protein
MLQLSVAKTQHVGDFDVCSGSDCNNNNDNDNDNNNNTNTNSNNNNKHAYAGTNDCFTHIRDLLVPQAPWHCGPISLASLMGGGCRQLK